MIVLCSLAYLGMVACVGSSFSFFDHYKHVSVFKRAVHLVHLVQCSSVQLKPAQLAMPLYHFHQSGASWGVVYRCAATQLGHLAWSFCGIAGGNRSPLARATLTNLQLL